jgi:hypothetical protein
MRQQMAQRDGLSRGAQLRGSFRIETIENLRRPKRRINFRRRFVQFEFVPLDEL